MVLGHLELVELSPLSSVLHPAFGGDLFCLPFLASQFLTGHKDGNLGLNVIKNAKYWPLSILQTYIE